MARVAGGEPVYAAAERWVEAALRSDDSLFTPGQPIWSLDNLNDFHQRFVGQPDESKESFFTKFERQLHGAPSQIFQLAAEVLYIHYLIAYPGAIGGNTKRQHISRVLSWSGLAPSMPEDITSALDSGFINPGSAFIVFLPAQVQLIIEFLQHWKRQTEATRTQNLDNPWALKEDLYSVEVPKSASQSMALLHLTYPDAFEPILSGYHKSCIRGAYTGLLKASTNDIDRDLLDVRGQLNRTYGINFHYYAPDLRTVWDPRLSAWERFIRWSQRFAEHTDFDRMERFYKEEIAENIQLARSALESGTENWLKALRHAFNQPNNLTNWREHTPFLDWCDKHPAAAADALKALWNEQPSIVAAIRDFLKLVPTDSSSGKHTRAKIAAFLAMALDPYAYPPYRVSTFEAAYKLTGHPLPATDADEAGVYQHALEFLDTTLAEASKYGLELRDRLDAQSVLWSITTDRFKDALPNAEHDSFQRYRAQVPLANGGDDQEGDGGVVPPPETLEALADRLLWDVSHLRNIQRLIEDKRQIVFYGPPGTGKTYVALELARHFAGDVGSTDLVQFHPSYAYEDFVEGFRPAKIADRPGFELREGPLKRIADAARAAHERLDVRHVLVIDEINRGNVARVFGELYFLLEYRDRQISLQYSEDPFTLPKNLWFIATMNTADRSIALVDAALRRRFHFIPFFPDQPPVKDLLRRWLAIHKPDLFWVADDILDEANAKLDDRNLAIGPSHFMRPDLDKEWVKLIWDHSILPYIQEQLFGETERLAEFELCKLCPQHFGVDDNGDATS